MDVGQHANFNSNPEDGRKFSFRAHNQDLLDLKLGKKSNSVFKEADIDSNILKLKGQRSIMHQTKP